MRITARQMGPASPGPQGATNPPDQFSSVTGGDPSLSPPVALSGRFEDYTLERYHEALHRLARLRIAYVVAVITLVLAAGLLFVGVRAPATSLGADFQWLTIAWLLPVPLLAIGALVYVGWFSEKRFAIQPTTAPSVDPRPVVLFQITSTGVNVETVLNTARSVRYWTGRHPEMGYEARVWLVVEGWGYAPNRERLDVLRSEGVEVVVVPTDYQTVRGTTRKGRALQFATDRRREIGLPLQQLWVYHHDDETAIGEDTVLGIDEFVHEHRDEAVVGCGIIVYSQQAEDFRPSQIQEFSRTKDDLRTIFTITSRHNMFSGFHGSHYIVRGDLEEATGWDVGPDMNSEDLIFETRVRAEHGPVFHLLKGFAHEQAALSLGDQLKQRRRWFQGWWRAVIHQPFPILRRIVMSYGMVVWMGAIFSLAAMLLSWGFGFTSIFPYTGFLTGFVWATMITGYYQGYVVHVPYLPPRRVSLPRIVANGIVGALADSIAPWYGTFTRRPRTFQVIVKDRTPAARPHPTPIATATGGGFSGVSAARFHR